MFIEIFLNFAGAKQGREPGACTIKLITAVIYDFRNKLVFAPGKVFQPCPMFTSKAYPSEAQAPFTCSTLA